MTRATHGTAGLLVLTAAAVLVRLLDAGPLVQPPVMAAFLLVAPGASLLGMAPTWSWLVWSSAVVACSLSTAMLVASALLFAGWWTPDRVLAVLLVVSVLGPAWQHARGGAVDR